jgi:hypothetical protein
MFRFAQHDTAFMISRIRIRISSLRVARVVPVSAFRKQAFAAALAPSRKCRPAAFGPHPGTETMLAFPCSFCWLISAFHHVGPLRERLQ